MMLYVEENSFKTIKMLFQHSRKKMTLCKGLTHDFGQKLAFSFKVFFKRPRYIAVYIAIYTKIYIAVSLLL